MKLKDRLEQNPLFKWIFYFFVGLAGITPLIYGLVKLNQGVSWEGILVLLIFLFIPCAAFLGIFFAPFLIDKTIASPIGQIFTGNPNIIEDKPIYGPVKANRNQGDYRQALNLVEIQLKKHPFDFDGLMLKAAIQAEDYHGLIAAKETLDIALTDKDQKRYNLPIVYNKIADWELDIFNSITCATQSLEKIRETYPGTKAAQLAAQRIASIEFYDESILAPTKISDSYNDIVEQSSRSEINEGLLKIPKKEKTDNENESEKLLSICLKRVEDHPESIINREDLARYYFDHKKEWEMAIKQYELLISMPGASTKQKVEWLNKIVDIKVKSGTRLEEITPILDRVVNINPESAAANRAQSRIMHLPIEIRVANKKKVPLKLKQHDEDLGLI